MRPMYYSQHAKAGMVYVKGKNCAHQSCVKHLSYGLDDGSKKAEYRSHHTKPGMVDIVRKRGAHQSCVKHPPYGVDDGKKKKAEYCSQHARAGVVYVKGKVAPNARFMAWSMAARRPSTGRITPGLGNGERRHEEEVLSPRLHQATVIRCARWQQEGGVLRPACQARLEW